MMAMVLALFWVPGAAICTTTVNNTPTPAPASVPIVVPTASNSATRPTPAQAPSSSADGGWPGEKSVFDFGASGDGDSISGTFCSGGMMAGVASISSVVCTHGPTGGSAPNNFAAHEGMLLLHAGPAPTFDGIACAAITPGTVSVEPTGGATGTRYCYEVAARSSGGGITKAGSSGCASNAAKLDPTHYNYFAWPATPGTMYYAIYRKAGAGAWEPFNQTSGTAYVDQGQGPGTINYYGVKMNFGYDVPFIPPGACLNDNLLLSVASVLPSAIALSGAPKQTGTFAFVHDDSKAFRDASNSHFQIRIPSHDRSGYYYKYRMTRTLTYDNASDDKFLLGVNGAVNFQTDTGTYPALEVVGTSGSRFRNFAINSWTEDIMPSQIGIMMQRSTTQSSCQGGSFDSIAVSLGSDPTAFGGVGTVAVYNNGCELTSLSHDWLNADTPYYGVGAGLVTATVQPPIKGAHGILNSSMKGVSFAQTDLIGMHGPCVWLEGQVYDFSFGNQAYCANNNVITTSSLAGTPFAFILGNGVNGGYWYNVTAESLDIEGYSQLLKVNKAGGALEGSKITGFGNAMNVSPLIELVGPATIRKDSIQWMGEGASLIRAEAGATASLFVANLILADQGQRADLGNLRASNVFGNILQHQDATIDALPAGAVGNIGLSAAGMKTTWP